jgi:hypothetical protein
MTVPDSAGTQATMSETDLVREAQAGSADAFERLYRKHGRRVYAVCLRSTGVRSARGSTVSPSMSC